MPTADHRDIAMTTIATAIAATSPTAHTESKSGQKRLWTQKRKISTTER